MRSSQREEVVEVFDALEAELKRALDLSFDALTTPERLALLQRCESLRRRLPCLENPLINQISEQANETELGGKLPSALANWLPISRGEASRRIHEAADLGERKAMTGVALQPVLPATAEAQRGGQIGPGHVAVIRGFWHRLPDFADVETRQKAEAQLARLGGEHRPDELSKLADKLTDCLNPDGNFTEHDRARRRGITIGRQDVDGMSPITGHLTPEARATLDAVFAKLAAPETGDTRSVAQRNHDALNAAGRALLASGASVSTTACRPASSSPPHCKSSNPAAAQRLPAVGHCCRCRMSSGWRVTPIITSPFSKTAGRWPCITADAWPRRRNESCCTRRIVAAHIPAATDPATSPKSIM